MKKRRILVAVLLIASAVVLLLLMPSNEPYHQGKALGRWMRECNAPDKSASPEEIHLRRQTFTNVVRALGTNALPYYVVLLEKESRHSFRSSRNVCGPIEVIRWRIHQLFTKPVPPGTINAFEILGPAAKPALPELTRLLGDPETSDQAALCLVAIGPDSIPILTNALLDANSPELTRFIAAEALGGITPPSPAVLPVLHAVARGDDPGLANAACEALIKAETNTALLLPLLAQRLSQSNTAYTTAVLLRRLGKAGMPLLQAALTNENRSARGAAEDVLGSVASPNQ
jgi:hypothetical protein